LDRVVSGGLSGLLINVVKSYSPFAHLNSALLPTDLSLTPLSTVNTIATRAPI